ncbi:hypothetical protein AB1N83_006145 [Pleurotus pulmonarius]
MLRLSMTVLVFLSVGGLLLASGTPLNLHSHPQTHAHRRRHLLSESPINQDTITRRDSDIVYSPPITYLSKDATITAGRPFTVTWSTKGVPNEKRNSDVDVLLGHGRGKNEHLGHSNPLAARVPIMEGEARVVVPQDTPSRSDYFVVVMDDSANKSPTFTVVDHH